MKYQICTRCVVDASMPDVVFDAHGECNYCKQHDAMERAFPLGGEGERQLAAMAEKIRTQGKGKPYDCILGVSGGTDSTYTLLLAHKYGLRPLAVHFDNGWATETAVRNIQNGLSKLGVELYTYVMDWEEYRDILKSYLKASLPWADAPTDLGIVSTLYRIAAREGVGYILIGQSFRQEGRMPDEWSYFDGRQMRYIQKRFGSTKLRLFPNLTLLDFIHFQFARHIQIFKPLNYIPYSKATARQTLKDELGWEYYGGHHYENIYTRFVYSVWLPMKFGIDKRKIPLAAQVRGGELSREQALDILATSPLDDTGIHEDTQYVLKKLGLTEAEFEQMLRAQNRSFRDYPSYFWIYERLRPIYAPIFRKFFPSTSPVYLDTGHVQGAGGEASQKGCSVSDAQVNATLPGKGCR